MSESHEKFYPEIKRFTEQPQEEVERFLKFSRRIFFHVNRELDTQWVYLIDKLFGNQELMQIDSNDVYKGIPGEREYLISECENGGPLALEVAFMNKIRLPAKDAKIPDHAIRTAFKKTLDFK